MKLDGSIILGRDQINALKARGLNIVAFPSPLEDVYRQEYCNGAAHEFRYRAPIILILCLYLSFGIYQTLPENQVLPWLSYYGWVWIIIAAAWVLSLFKFFNRWFDLYTCLGSAAAVAITFTMITTLEGGQDHVLYHSAMMYAVVIIYGFVGMRFYTAAIAGWLGGLIAFIISMSLNSQIEWTFLNRTYTFSSLLGMSLAYVTDRQHRENYLQNCMIEINKLELMQQAKQLSALSRLDALTGLANRRYLDEVLKIEWNRAIRHRFPLTIMMVDIDYFKLYNDSLGHIEGDECLRKIASTISSIASRAGDLVARYGGEEFLLLFPSTNQEQAKIQAQRLMDIVHQIAISHPNSQVSPQVTISVGIATIIPNQQDHISEFIDRADQALYAAKINGRNQYQIG